MGCGCGKKKKVVSLFTAGRPIRRVNQPNTNIVINSTNEATTNNSTTEDIEYITNISPSDWGPLLWKLFHIMAERIGNSGVDSLDRDMAIALEFILEHIPHILPCFECQNHARTYIRSHPFNQIKNKRGIELQNFVRQYFFEFHNHVRISTGKPITIATVDECKKLYENIQWQKCEMEQATEYFSFGVHHSIIKAELYKRWMAQVHKLRLIAGF